MDTEDPSWVLEENLIPSELWAVMKRQAYTMAMATGCEGILELRRLAGMYSEPLQAMYARAYKLGMKEADNNNTRK